MQFIISSLTNYTVRAQVSFLKTINIKNQLSVIVSRGHIYHTMVTAKFNTITAKHTIHDNMKIYPDNV